MKTINITRPSTVRVQFSNNMPLRFEVYNERGKLFHFRELNGQAAGIKFNIPVPGLYRFSEDCINVRLTPIEINPIKVPLPPAVRNFDSPTKFVVNPKLTYTPARIFPNEGKIEVSKKFLTLPFPVRKFILLHEEGHKKYANEDHADHYALDKYIKQGYNNSMAYHTLNNVLQPSPEKQKRINSLLKKLNYADE